VHGKEGEVDSEEKEPKVHLGQGKAVEAAHHGGVELVEGGKDAEHGAHGEHVVEVGHHVVAVVETNVQGVASQLNTLMPVGTAMIMVAAVK
jgi:hypothetical protein